MRHRIQHTHWWYYPLAIFSPRGTSIVPETEITALALHTACALNATQDSLSLLNEEVYQLIKVALQNCMDLDMLTVS